jgi:hypothetical protein
VSYGWQPASQGKRQNLTGESEAGHLVMCIFMRVGVLLSWPSESAAAGYYVHVVASFTTAAGGIHIIVALYVFHLQ